jgi:flagellar M-ring protein FliF
MVGRVLAVEEKTDEDGDAKPDLDLLTGELKPALAAPIDTSNMTEEEIALLETEIENGALGEGKMIDVESVQGKVKASSVKKIEDIVENYPTETVSVIRSWMAED